MAFGWENKSAAWGHVSWLPGDTKLRSSRPRSEGGQRRVIVRQQWGVVFLHHSTLLSRVPHRCFSHLLHFKVTPQWLPYSELATCLFYRVIDRHSHLSDIAKTLLSCDVLSLQPLWTGFLGIQLSIHWKPRLCVPSSRAPSHWSKKKEEIAPAEHILA